MRGALGLPLVALSTLLVLVVGVTEAWDGLATVADTGTLISAVLLLILLVTLVVRFAGDRTASWRAPTLNVLAVIAVALVVLMLVATFRAHTSSDRFADRMDDFPLPRDYESASTRGVDARSQGEPQHVIRAWQVPAGADACAAMTRAFETWADPPREEFTRSGSCSVTSNDQAEKAEVHVSSDGSLVILEMWVDGSSD
jgi:hypothetical protein